METEAILAVLMEGKKVHLEVMSENDEDIRELEQLLRSPESQLVLGGGGINQIILPENRIKLTATVTVKKPHAALRNSLKEVLGKKSFTILLT